MVVFAGFGAGARTWISTAPGPPPLVTFSGEMPPAAGSHDASAGEAKRGAGEDGRSLPRDEIRWFNGRPIHPADVIPMRVTAYSPDARSCGAFADNVTASGYSVWTNGMRLAAADTKLLPFGSLISVPGYDDGAVVPVLDRGGRIKGRRLDVLFPTHEEAMEWGVRQLPVVVWEYADGRPHDFSPGRPVSSAP